MSFFFVDLLVVSALPPPVAVSVPAFPAVQPWLGGGFEVGRTRRTTGKMPIHSKRLSSLIAFRRASRSR